VVCPAQDQEEEVGLWAYRHGGTFEAIEYPVWGSQVSALAPSFPGV
jgi:hypothetical protein